MTGRQLDHCQKQKHGKTLHDQNNTGPDIAPQQGQGSQSGNQYQQMHHLHCPFPAHAQMQKTMGNMIVVADINRFVIVKTYLHHRKGIENGNRQNKQGNQNSKAGGCNFRIEKRDLGTDDAQQKCQKMTAGIPHENRCRIPVVQPETASLCTGTCTQCRNQILSVDAGGNGKKQKGDCRGAHSQTIHIVKKVDGIQNKQDPENGNKAADPDVVDKTGDPDAPAEHNGTGNENLTGKFFTGFHGVTVVPQSQQNCRQSADTDNDQFP